MRWGKKALNVQALLVGKARGIALNASLLRIFPYAREKSIVNNEETGRHNFLATWQSMG